MQNITTIYVTGGRFDITINENGGGEITSQGLRIGETYNRDDIPFNAAIDGLESFLLALACVGLDLHDSRIKRALETTLELIDNHYG